jgi:serine/threonine protein kinase
MHEGDWLSGRYIIMGLISEETTSLVYQVKDQEIGEKFAMKFPKPGNTQTLQEHKMLRRLSHPHIVELRDIVKTANGPSLVLPFAAGGDLFSIVERGPIPESQAKPILYFLLKAINYLHQQKIWHRDIKPENILFLKQEFGPECVVLSDFGYAREFPAGVARDEPCGSPHYAAPEMFQGVPYTEAVDIWAFGITMYVTLTGRMPFGHSDPPQMVAEILKRPEHLFSGSEIPPISESGKELIRQMLKLRPEDRISADRAMNHPYFEPVRREEFSEDDDKSNSRERDGESHRPHACER